MRVTTCSPLIEEYFSRLESRLADLPQKQRNDFVRELRAHVSDRFAETSPANDQDCRAILTALGTPDEIARQYRLECILSKSSWKISPITVLRAIVRWTVPGIQGFVIFCVAVIGYMLSACFYIAALLKPFFPRNVGAFVSTHGLNLANFPSQPRGHDVLGIYFIPVAVVVGYLLTCGTTLLIHFIASRGRKIRQSL